VRAQLALIPGRHKFQVERGSWIEIHGSRPHNLWCSNCRPLHALLQQSHRVLLPLGYKHVDTTHLRHRHTDTRRTLRSDPRIVGEDTQQRRRRYTIAKRWLLGLGSLVRHLLLRLVYIDCGSGFLQADAALKSASTLAKLQPSTFFTERLKIIII